MPTYSDEKGIVKGPRVGKDENWKKLKELEKELKRKDRLLEEEREKVEILKKRLPIFMEQRA